MKLAAYLLSAMFLGSFAIAWVGIQLLTPIEPTTLNAIFRDNNQQIVIVSEYSAKKFNSEAECKRYINYGALHDTDFQNALEELRLAAQEFAKRFPQGSLELKCLTASQEKALREQFHLTPVKPQGQDVSYTYSQLDALTQKAIVKGYILDGPDGTQLKVLESTVPSDKTQTHRSDYYSVVGIMGDVQFAPIALDVVSETWTREADGTWTIDQWLFIVSLEGKVMRCDHNIIRETADNTGLPGPTQPPQPTDAEAQKVLDSVYAHWIDE